MCVVCCKVNVYVVKVRDGEIIICLAVELGCNCDDEVGMKTNFDRRWLRKSSSWFSESTRL